MGLLTKALVTLIQVPSRLKEELLKCKKMMESRLQAQQKKVAMYMMCSPLSLLGRKCTVCCHYRCICRYSNRKDWKKLKMLFSPKRRRRKEESYKKSVIKLLQYKMHVSIYRNKCLSKRTLLMQVIQLLRLELTDHHRRPQHQHQNVPANLNS